MCSELLYESLDALQSLPEATLFKEGSVSRASTFLNFLKLERGQRIPVQNQQVHVALTLLLEFAVQRGSLGNIMSSVLMLLNLRQSDQL